MRIKEYLKEIRKQGRVCFTVQDIVRENALSRPAARMAISGLLKSGDLVSPAKGFYVIVPPEYQPYGSIPARDLIPLLMRHWQANYYVALLSAGLFYGATHQKPAKFQVISDKRIKRQILLGDVEIQFVYKKSITELPIKIYTVNTGYINVATPELIALDLLSYPDHAGGLNHIATVLAELFECLDVNKLINLAEQTNTVYQLQRIGYIIDAIDVLDNQADFEFQNQLNNYVIQPNCRYIPLASEIPTKGYTKDKKWKVIVNSTIESDL